MIGTRRVSVAAGAAMFAILMAASANAQSSRAVNPSQTYQRLLMIVPITGSGTHADPRRPLYIAAPQEMKSGAGIIAFSSLDSDDKKWALVEVVALDRAAFQPILDDKSVRTFDRKSSTKSDIESEFQKYRKGFHLEDFKPAVVR